MGKNNNIMLNVPLFAGIKEEELENVLSCIGAVNKSCKKNDIIFHSGSEIDHIGVVLSGNVHIISEDIFGYRSIIADMEAGDVFGEVFSYAKIRKIPISVIAVTESEILMLDSHKIISPCGKACDYHKKLIENMLMIFAQKTYLLNKKILILSKRSTRDKVLSYLDLISKEQGTNTFNIPFDRQQLADFLCVDRSALSNELSQLKNEGIIDFYRSSFKLLLVR